MKKILVLLVFMPFIFSCSSGGDDSDNIVIPEGDMKLAIVNNFTKWNITQVSLQGYKFENLSIGGNSSRTFTLSDGIPSGSMDIQVEIVFTCQNRDGMKRATNVDFYSGKTTTITINPTPDDTPDSVLADCYLYDFVVTN